MNGEGEMQENILDFEPIGRDDGRTWEHGLVYGNNVGSHV
jgi:hypothetical protein